MLSPQRKWDNRLCLGFLQKRQAWEEDLVVACCICGVIDACRVSRVVRSDWSQAFQQGVNAEGRKWWVRSGHDSYVAQG